jgi:hypothetical protein
MGAVTHIAASAAIADIACGAYLAAVSKRVVAVMVGARARANGADATCALTDSIGGCAFGAASAAVVNVDSGIDFAAVASYAITVGKTIVAGAHVADPYGAHGRRIGDDTPVATTPAVLWVCILVGFATRGCIIIAIAKRKLTVRNATRAVNAGCGAIGKVLTDLGA